MNYLAKLNRLKNELEAVMATDNELGPSSPIEGDLVSLVAKVDGAIDAVERQEAAQ